jgi:hypothetical protein
MSKAFIPDALRCARVPIGDQDVVGETRRLIIMENGYVHLLYSVYD